MKIHNKIAYSIFLIAICLMFVVIANLLDFIIIEYKYFDQITAMIASGLGEIYRKLQTIPLTEAISNYWKYKIRKEDKNKHNHSQDYASFKDEQNKKEKTFK